MISSLWEHYGIYIQTRTAMAPRDHALPRPLWHHTVDHNAAIDRTWLHRREHWHYCCHFRHLLGKSRPLQKEKKITLPLIEAGKCDWAVVAFNPTTWKAEIFMSKRPAWLSSRTMEATQRNLFWKAKQATEREGRCDKIIYICRFIYTNTRGELHRS